MSSKHLVSNSPKTLTPVPTTTDCYIEDKKLKTDSSLTTELANEFLNANQVAQYLKLPLQTVRNLTSNGKIPHYKLGSSVRYRTDDLRQLLLEQSRGVKNGNKI
jgi:excisionase family DNA binding protein